MTDAYPSLSLLEHANGVAEPLYFDRQIIRAADLNLGRESGNAELDRMRRYALGTGIVAGLTLVPLEKDVISVRAGYGITPSGNELFLDRDIELGGLVEALKELCEIAEDDCSLDENEGLPTLRAWLVARPILKDAENRPGVSDDCGHPANMLRPSRACHNVEFALLKDPLPPALVLPDITCNLRNPFVCGGEPVPFVDRMEAYSASDGLVLGEVGFDDEIFFAVMNGRRRLLPAQVVQEWIIHCLCNRDDTEPQDDTDTDTDDADDQGNLIGNLKDKTWLEVDRAATFFGYASRLTNRPARDVDKLDGIPNSPTILSPPMVALLQAQAINTPQALFDLEEAKKARLFGTAEVAEVYLTELRTFMEAAGASL